MGGGNVEWRKLPNFALVKSSRFSDSLMAFLPKHGGRTVIKPNGTMANKPCIFVPTAIQPPQEREISHADMHGKIINNGRCVSVQYLMLLPH